MKKNKEKKLAFLYGFSWLIIATIIFFFSSQTVEESYKVSSGVVNAVNQTVNQFVEWNSWLVLRRFIWNNNRKIAHVLLYAIMGALGSLTLKGVGDSLRKGMGLGIFINVFYAISDELHQLMVPGRGAKTSDLFIDIIGVLCGSFFVYILCRKKNNSSNNNQL